LEGVLHEPELRVDRLPRGDHVATLTEFLCRELLISELVSEFIERTDAVLRR
jgi:hypothetical protein